MKKLAVALLCLAVCACQTPREAARPEPVTQPSPVTPPAPVRLTLVGTNDVHGWAAAQAEKFPAGEVRFGGLAAFSAYVKALRADNPGGVVLLDAGDMFQGTLVSNLSEGRVIVEIFNALGYDAASVGNHEFDYGPVGPAPVATKDAPDPFGALKARIAQAKFPILSANIYEAASSARPAWLPGDGTVLLERQGLKVGIIGLTTPQTPTVTTPINVATLRFAPLADEAKAGAERLRARGADVVVAVMHAGGRCPSAAHPHELTGCDEDVGEVFGMMNALPPGTLDAVVAGHSHALLGHFINGTPVIESYSFGRAFGVIELFVDLTTKKVLAEQTVISPAIEVCETWDEASHSCDVKKLKARAAEVKPVVATFRGAPVTPDAEVLALIAPAQAAVDELQHKPLGLDVPEDLVRAYEKESALGDVFSDGLRGAAHADIALMNPGGFRADLRAGPLTYGAVYEVIPFDNTVALVTVTAEQLGRMLNAAYGARKGVFQISGLEVKLKKCLVTDRLLSFTLTGGKKLDPKKKYRVAMPDFLARGGDGLGPALATLEKAQVDLQENKGTNVRDELIGYWQAKKAALKAPKPDRVSFIDSGEACAAPEAH